MTPTPAAKKYYWIACYKGGILALNSAAFEMPKVQPPADWLIGFPTNKEAEVAAEFIASVTDQTECFAKLSEWRERPDVQFFTEPPEKTVELWYVTAAANIHASVLTQ